MKLPLILSGVLLLSACGVSPPAATTTALDAETLALSCSELRTRNARIASRLNELEADSQTRARRQAVTDTAIGVGLGAIIGVDTQGGIDGIRAASATVKGIENIRVAERGNGSMQEVSDTLALAKRSSELQRTMIEKGCI